MKNQIIKLADKKYKVVAFSDNDVIFSSKSHSSFESLEASLNNSGLMETIESISIETITELKYNEAQKDFKITYTNEKGKIKKKALFVKNKEQRDVLVSEIAALKSLQQSTSQESRVKPLFAGILIITFIGYLTYWFRNVAINAQNGGHEVVTTRKGRFLGQLFVNGAEAIGPTGVLILGGLGIAFLYLKVLRD